MNTIDLPALDDSDALAAWAAGVNVCRYFDPHAVDGHGLDALSSWLTTLAIETGRVWPVPFVADIGAMVFERAHRVVHRASAALRPSDPAAEHALHRFADRVLGRLALDRAFGECAFHAAHLPDDDTERLGRRALARLIERIAAAAGAQGFIAPAADLMSAALVRAAESMALPDAASLEPLEELTDGVVAARELLLAQDQFEFRHFATLAGIGQRLAIRQLIGESARISAAIPRTAPARVRSRGAITAAVSREDRFPAGGFTALTTRGAIENLLPSELIYRDDRTAVAAAVAEIDLFDLRFVEGELLYYARDEGILTRPRRNIWLVLDGSLREARRRDPRSPLQTIIHALAVIHRSLEAVREWLSAEALHITIAAAGRDLPEEELDLLAIAFAGRIDAGTVAIELFDTPAHLEAAMAATSEDSPPERWDIVWRDAPGQKPRKRRGATTRRNVQKRGEAARPLFVLSPLQIGGESAPAHDAWAWAALEFAIQLGCGVTPPVETGRG